MDPITILTILSGIGGMVFPAVVDFCKKKFIPSSADTPERTMGTLATTKPEVLASYTDSMGKYLLAQKDYFNRDIAGTPSTWVVNLRACIRPLATVGSIVLLGIEMFCTFSLDPATRAGLVTVVTNWVGSRVI
jgi:hypothetical protein